MNKASKKLLKEAAKKPAHTHMPTCKCEHAVCIRQLSKPHEEAHTHTFPPSCPSEPLQNETRDSLQDPFTSTPPHTGGEAACSRLVCMQTEYLLHLAQEICRADSAEDGEGGGLGWWEWSIFGGIQWWCSRKHHQGMCSAQGGEDFRCSVQLNCCRLTH